MRIKCLNMCTFPVKLYKWSCSSIQHMLIIQLISIATIYTWDANLCNRAQLGNLNIPKKYYKMLPWSSRLETEWDRIRKKRDEEAGRERRDPHNSCYNFSLLLIIISHHFICLTYKLNFIVRVALSIRSNICAQSLALCVVLGSIGGLRPWALS